MRGAFPLLCLAVLAASTTAHAREVAGDEYAFVEIETVRETYYVHEPIPVRLRFGFDTDYFRTNAIQLFRRELQVPVQIEAPWLPTLPGTVVLAEGAESAADERRVQRSFALNDDVAQATRVEDRRMDGRTFTVLEIEHRLLPEESGELMIPAPLLRFAHATRFQDDFISGRVPVDRIDVAVSGASTTLTIHELPYEGRPPEFTGAVGRFSIRAQAAERKIAVGEILKLELRIEGSGNLGYFEPPRLDVLAGAFHVYGMIEELGAGSQTLRYDIAPLRSSVAAVPSIPFAYFDSGPPAGYRMVETGRLPIDVTSGTEEPGTVPAPDPSPAPAPGAEPGRWLAPLVAGVLALCLVGVGVVLWRRGRTPVRRDADEARAHDAASTFDSQVTIPGTDLADAFAEYLSSRLRCPAAAVISPELSSRLAEAGVPPDPASRAAALLERLVAERYGGGSTDGADAEVRATVSEVESCFRRAERDA